ncbi:5'-nucleotidase, lipoprotein e(P4) family [Coraliomargarita parva]|uniref:5'-nucleotidase, lipoprotein e(P4) family n=1 Tax=Coraliomargarita parva TaxID=3014050 RepID=UPI0022B50C0A|nr:5'-nucleotidase, lipoprotein e(P4) family [Coraliomargarita parva]
MKRLFPLLAGACALLYHTGCQTSPNLNAVTWMQDAGEYRALCLQAFNLATAAYDQAAKANEGPLAVMVDLDETMLDNSPYAAWQVLGDHDYEPATWDQWVREEQTPALPGALEFAQYVTRKGGTMFYVSNRSDATYEATFNNLVRLGFPGVNDQTLLLKTDSSNKAPRLASIEAAGYKIVLLLGDNLNDFPELGTYHQLNDARQAAVDARRGDFGKRFILLPNPSYGDWEPGLAGDFYQQDAAGQNRLRRESLRPWAGPR